nr:hypothetical protein [Acetobacter persici]
MVHAPDAEMLARAAIEAGDAVIAGNAINYYGRYEITLPLTIGQSIRFLDGIEETEDVVECCMTLSDNMRKEAKLIEQLPEPDDEEDAGW